jgi:AmmeMemoRadiSam system protein B
MNKQISTLVSTLLILLLIGCSTNSSIKQANRVRQMVDTVGFAHLSWQVDSVVNRIERTYSKELAAIKVDPSTVWRVAICPHDDYTYASWHYSALLKNLKAKTIIIFGVAHKARQLNVADQIVFDSFTHWHGAYSDIKVSSLRDELMKAMPNGSFQVNDSLQKVEHSVESMLPFIQHFNRDVEIISILVPFMTFDRMNEIAKPLSAAIASSMKMHDLQWGKDVALLITTDAVHYGDEDWGGKNMAPYGVDSAGYQLAIKHEYGIIDSCLVGDPNLENVKRFIDITVQPNNYREYKWTWCGRYSVPLGLITAIDLQQANNSQFLTGQFIDYSTSIDHKPLNVEDLRMGKTANATIRHWVGYASVGYK